MDIQEADIAAMGRAEVEELIDRAVRPDVPLRVLFAALDRYTELLRPMLDGNDDNAENTDNADTVPETGAQAEGWPAKHGVPPRQPGIPGPPPGIQGLSGFSAVSGLPDVMGLQGRSSRRE